MSMYTTGEIAKMCNVSVRTVQFYDVKGLLPPSEVTEGGRRLYTDTDLIELRYICTLKELGCSLDSIKGILKNKSRDDVLKLLLDEQAKRINDEIDDRKTQLEAIRLIKDNVNKNATISVNLKSGIEHMMKKEELKKKSRKIVIASRIIFISLLSGSIAIWVTIGTWIPFASVVFIFLVLLGFWLFAKISNQQHKFICSQCKEEFILRTKDLFNPSRSQNLEYATCPNCGKEEYCVKAYVKS